MGMRITTNQDVRNVFLQTVPAKETAVSDFSKIIQKTYEESIKERIQDVGNFSFYKADPGVYTRNIGMNVEADHELDTDRYHIYEKDGTLWIRDKWSDSQFRYRFHSVGFDGMIQIDEKSGQRFMFDDFGAGFFTVQPVDDELYNGLKEFFQTDILPEKEMSKFTLNTDAKTGIQYVTANGYEWQGGHIIMTEDARKKLNALAETYRKDYPGTVKSYEEAYFYASFEVRGLAARVQDGIMMLGKDHIDYKGKEEKYNWTVYFEEQYWDTLKRIFEKEISSKKVLSETEGIRKYLCSLRNRKER